MKGLPDLHRHLDGSLRLSTLRELAGPLDIVIPEDLAFFPGMGLFDALGRFEITLSVLQSPAAVRRVADEMCQDAARGNTSTLEIRFAPQLHKGASIPEIVDAALEGVDGRAGLLLCGLYGEPPSVLESLVDAAATRPGVVGVDIAGGPSSGDNFNLADYQAPFRRAADLGLGRTVHAGEGRPPEEIRVAIEVLGAQRIGHGTTLLDDPAVLSLIVERQIVIEACPTSNWHTGVIDTVSDHPLPIWLSEGVKACICSDNVLFSEVDATEEHRRAREIPGMDDKLMWRAIEIGHDAAFKRA